jgi:FKBP-type peptidyl-prolyl cis-trans isomerase
MNMSKRCIKKIGLAVLLYALCFNAIAQYTSLTSQLQYRICTAGSSAKRVTTGCYVYLRVTGAAEGEAAAFSERYWLRIDDMPRQNSLHRGLTKLKLGDSAEFVLPYRLVLACMVNLPRIKSIEAKDQMTLGVKVLKIEDKNVMFSADGEKFGKQQEQQQQYFMKKYFKDNSAQFELQKRNGNIYKRTLRSGNGKQLAKYGDVAFINYTGRFLNGMRFDNTPKNEPFRYVQGMQFQMIKGIEMILKTMSEGERAQLVIPSGLAFGSKGLADIVPPFVPVIYDIELIRIDRK